MLSGYCQNASILVWVAPRNNGNLFSNQRSKSGPGRSHSVSIRGIFIIGLEMLQLNKTGLLIGQKDSCNQENGLAL